MSFGDIFIKHPKLDLKFNKVTMNDLRNYESFIYSDDYSAHSSLLDDIAKYIDKDRDILYRFLREPYGDYDLVVTKGKLKRYPERVVYRVTFVAGYLNLCSMFILTNNKESISKNFKHVDIAGVAYYDSVDDFYDLGITLGRHDYQSEGYYIPRYIGAIYLLLLNHDLVENSFLPILRRAAEAENGIEEPEPYYKSRYYI